MPYVRLSIVHPRHSQEGRVLQLMTSLAEAVRAKEGCSESYVMQAKDGGDIARVTTFADEAVADESANDPHIMSLRAELHLAVDTQVERAFETI
ncbi:MAG: hypothetical protein ACE5EF_04135 [Dehalococcoidia bacterium]